MKIKRFIEELQEAMTPYLFFWNEWTDNDNCNLNPDEIAFINHYLKNGFQPSLLELFRLNYHPISFTRIIQKLKGGYPIFKEFVIVNFLMAIVAMAKTYGRESFLQAPINQLNIPENLKTSLRAFKCYTLQHMFIIYKPSDLSCGWVYKRIVEFQTVRKKYEAVLTNK